MTIQPKIRNAALVAALAAVTATAWATSETLSPSVYVPAPTVSTEASSPEQQAEPVVAVSDSLAPNESVVAPDEATAPAPRLVQREVVEPPVTVEERRLTTDQRIQADVIDRIAQAANLSGKIGVESHDSMVTLTGYTSTSGQAYRAGKLARAVIGVREVDNQIRPRVGGSV